MEQSKGEAELALQIRALKMREPIREFRFDADRKWRFDFAWPELRFAVEIEGITRQGGRHQRIGGFLADLEKYHAAHVQGWRIYRVSAQMVSSGVAIQGVQAGIDHAINLRRSI